MKIPKEIKHDVTKLNCSNCDFIVNRNLDAKTIKGIVATYGQCSACFYFFLATIMNYYPVNYKHIIYKIFKYYDDREFIYSFPCYNNSLVFDEGKTLKFIFKLLKYNYNKLEIE